MEIIKDPRMIEVRNIINTIIPVVDRPFSNIMITEANTLVIIIRDTAIYTTQLGNINQYTSISCFRYIDIADLADDECVNIDAILFKSMNTTYNFYCQMVEKPQNLLVSETNVRQNEEFESLMGLKSTDGMEFFKIHGKSYDETYLVPIISKYPALNKADTIDIYVYNTGDGCFLNVMDVFKKKIKRNIKLYFRTMNLMKG